MQLLAFTVNSLRRRDAPLRRPLSHSTWATDGAAFAMAIWETGLAIGGIRCGRDRIPTERPEELLQPPLLACTDDNQPWLLDSFRRRSVARLWRRRERQLPHRPGRHFLHQRLGGRLLLKGTASQTLVEHWNGKTWKVQPSPNPGKGTLLFGVAATSSTNAWAVGYYNAAPRTRP